MGMRLSKIVTRTGDDGTTGLGDGTRIRKDHLRVQALGDVDELNCVIGVVLAEPLAGEHRHLLLRAQHLLFDLGAEICIPGHRALDAAAVSFIDAAAEDMNSSLPPLREFILPGGSRAAALCHQARAVARRAERSLVALHADEPVSTGALQFMNRLSDLLFGLARAMNRHAGSPDVLWSRERAGDAA